RTRLCRTQRHAQRLARGNDVLFCVERDAVFCNRQVGNSRYCPWLDNGQAILLACDGHELKGAAALVLCIRRQQHTSGCVAQFGFDVCRAARSEEHTSELQSRENLVCRLLLEKKKLLTAVLLTHRNQVAMADPVQLTARWA